MNCKTNKIICIALCFIALIGFMLPAVNFEINFFGNSRSLSFNALSPLYKHESVFKSADLSGQGVFNIMGESVFSDLFDEIRLKMIIPIGMYFMTLTLLIVILAFELADRLKRVINIMLGLSLIFFIYAGYGILSVAQMLIQNFENSLGVIASFTNSSDLIEVDLGGGYWLTLIMHGCVLVTKIIFCFLFGYRMETKN